MTTIPSFANRLKKIGIIIELLGNFPWVYLDSVNGIKVKERYKADHGFTVFMQSIRMDQNDQMMDITLIFKKIRQILCNPTEDTKIYERQMEDYYS